MENKTSKDYKPLLTLKEAAEFTGIGVNKLRELTNKDRCDFVLFVGNRRFIKTDKLLRFIDNTYSI